MALLLKEKLVLTPLYNKRHIAIPFAVHKNSRKFKIAFSYIPEEDRSEHTIALVKEAMEFSHLDSADAALLESYLPIRNLITLSLAREETYMGAYHNKKTEQRIEITESQASAGFLVPKKAAGQWALSLDCHCIVSSEVIVNLEISDGND